MGARTKLREMTTFMGGQGFVFYASPGFTLDQLLTATSYVLNSIGLRTCLIHTLPQPCGQARLMVSLKSILESTTTTWTYLFTI
jgi:hypothetical protein